MGLLNFIKKKELSQIAALQQYNEDKDNCILSLQNEIDSLKKECESYAKYKNIVDIEEATAQVMNRLVECQQKFAEYKNKVAIEVERMNVLVDNLSSIKSEKEKQIVELDDKILLQSFGLYSPVYEFSNSSQYKDRLDALREEQKDMIRFGTAATCSQVWSVNGSEAQGRRMTQQNINQILRCFNDECDVLIDKVKFNNVVAFEDKLCKSFDALNRMNTKNSVSISPKYLDLKLKELRLAHEFMLKKQEEKEEQKRIREQMREEAKLQKEIEAARKDIEKEQKHYANALSKINEQIETCGQVEIDVLLERKADIQRHLAEIETAIKDIDYREANRRAGYVYVISNIGSFGECVYKIGMTRRLDPMERIDELGDASVPFKFDVHAMIFSDDAPGLEAALHKAFEDKKVNMINNRREFFKVTLDEIESVVKANYDKTVEFVKDPPAEQYRESIKIHELFNNRISQ